MNKDKKKGVGAETVVLRLLNAECADNRYAIIEAGDLLAQLNGYSLDKAGLKELIDRLTERKMLAVKYSDLDEYCLTVLPNGKIDTTELQSPLCEKKLGGRQIFWMGFLGGACAVALYEIIKRIAEVLFC